jgi:hypothetical protein
MGAQSPVPRVSARDIAIRPAGALKLFHRVPPWAVVHAQPDAAAAPMIEQGDIVVVDPGACNIEHGALLLVEYSQSKPVDLRRRAVREVFFRINPTTGTEHWWLRPPAGPFDPAGRVMFCSDGPYACITSIGAITVGRVVGLLSSSLQRKAS